MSNQDGQQWEIYKLLAYQKDTRKKGGDSTAQTTLYCWNSWLKM